MKLQSMAVIFAIIVIPMTLILSAYIGIEIDTAALQQSYDTKLLDATYDAVVAFQLNSIENDYSTNADSLRRDIKASINTFFTSLATNLGTPGASTSYITQYVPAVVVTLYDGYYIYSPVEKEYEENGVTKTKYEHTLKPYIHYSVEYKTGDCDIVVNYSLDNYITVYGYMGNEYISRSGYLIAYDSVSDQNFLSDDGTMYRGITITDETAIKYYEAAKNFTNWIKKHSFNGTGSKIVDIVTPQNAVVDDESTYAVFNSNEKILNVTTDNDPEYTDSTFTAYKREVMKQSIQSNLNNAIKLYGEHTTLSTDFSMPILSETEWDKVLSNVNIITFMQGFPVGTTTYNNYAIITSTENKQFVDKELLYYIKDANGDGKADDGYYHTLDCEELQSNSSINIVGYRSIAYNAKKDDDGNYTYEHTELGCYKCIVESTNTTQTADEIASDENVADNIKRAYYNTLARERYNLNQPSVTKQTDAEEILDTVPPSITITARTTNSLTFVAKDLRTGVAGYKITTNSSVPEASSFTTCNNTEVLEKTIQNLTQNTIYYVWAIDESGNIGMAVVTTDKIPSASEILTFSQTPNKDIWTNGNVEVTAISKDLKYIVYLSLNENFTDKQENTITVQTNGIVYARLEDNIGQVGEFTTYEVLNIDKEKPVITSLETTTNSVTIKATDNASGIIGYQVTTSNSNTPETFASCEKTFSLDVTVGNLYQNTTYYVWVKDEAGNIASKSCTTRQVSPAVGNITFSSPVWNSSTHKATVTLSKGTNVSSGFSIQYQVNSTTGTWTAGTNITNLSLYDVIYARLWDGTNGGEYATLKVVEKIEPTVNVTVDSTTTNSITVSVSSSDAQSGMPSSPTYNYYIKESSATSYGNSKYSGTKTSYKFEGLKQNTTYDIKVEAKDNAGNNGAGNEVSTTGIDKTAPVVKYNSTISVPIDLTLTSTTIKSYSLVTSITDTSSTSITNIVVKDSSGNTISNNKLSMYDYYTVSYSVIDAAGNSTVVTQTVYTLPTEDTEIENYAIDTERDGQLLSRLNWGNYGSEVTGFEVSTWDGDYGLRISYTTQSFPRACLNADLNGAAGQYYCRINVCGLRFYET